MCDFLGHPVCIFLPLLERCSIFNDQFPVCLFINRLRISPKTPIGLVADLSLVTCSNQNLSYCGFVDISPTLQQFLPTRRHEKTSRRKGKSPTTLVNSPNELDRLPQLRIEMTSLSATKPVGEWVDSSLTFCVGKLTCRRFELLPRHGTTTSTPTSCSLDEHRNVWEDPHGIETCYRYCHHQHFA